MEIPPTAVVSASDIGVSYGRHLVLDHATVAINEGERVGLVGRNGSGKSTFLRILAGELQPDSGQVTRRRDLITGFLPQQFLLDEEKTVSANILSGASGILALIHEYEQLPGDSARASGLLDRINHLDGWTLDHRAKSLSTHLHAPEGDRIVSTLSGGEKRRVALCRALIARPDLLVLDEPTNHLDTESILWLETFLASYPGTCLFVTHDRYFLDRVATRIIELSQGGFFSHQGNYTTYLEAKAAREFVAEQQERRRQSFLRRELEWVRRGPSARRTKSVDRIERFYEISAQAAPEEELDVQLLIPPAPKLANRVIDLENVRVKTGDRVLVDALTLSIPDGARIGIVGRNGLGKTSLLRVIIGEMPPAAGEVRIGARTQINYVDQGRLLLDEEKTVFAEVGGGSEYVRLGEENIAIRSYLRRFLFTEDRINTQVAQLSGGERNRVVLAKILKRGGNVLILDEPTNDLDLATLRVLEEALLVFTGTVLVVSHDRYFLNRVCTHILAFEGDGRVVFNVGNYDDYLERKKSETPQQPEAVAEESPKPESRTTRKRKLSYKETRELESMEPRILETENEIAGLEAKFADPDFYAKHGSEWESLQEKLAAAKELLPTLYARWEELEAIRAEQA